MSNGEDEQTAAALDVVFLYVRPDLSSEAQRLFLCLAGDDGRSRGRLHFLKVKNRLPVPVVCRNIVAMEASIREQRLTILVMDHSEFQHRLLGLLGEVGQGNAVGLHGSLSKGWRQR